MYWLRQTQGDTVGERTIDKELGTCREMLEVKEEKVSAAFCFAGFLAVDYQYRTVKLNDLEWLPDSSDLTTDVELAMVWPHADNIVCMCSTGTAKSLR